MIATVTHFRRDLWHFIGIVCNLLTSYEHYTYIYIYNDKQDLFFGLEKCPLRHVFAFNCNCQSMRIRAGSVKIDPVRIFPAAVFFFFASSNFLNISNQLRRRMKEFLRCVKIRCVVLLQRICLPWAAISITQRRIKHAEWLALRVTGVYASEYKRRNIHVSIHMRNNTWD